MNPWTFATVAVICITVASVVQSWVTAKYGKSKDEK